MAWVLGLGLAAGYLTNKRIHLTNALDEAQRENDVGTRPDSYLPSQVIREQQRRPNVDRYRDMNTQDLTHSEMESMARRGDRLVSEAAEYEGHGSIKITGEYFQMERGESLS